MSNEVINLIKVTDKNELMLCIEGVGHPSYQYVYREAAGVYWDNEQHGFKSTPMSDWSCSQWFAHIIAIAKSGAVVNLTLGKDVQWQDIPESEKNAILNGHAI